MKNTKNDPCIRAGVLFFEDIMIREAWCGSITEEPDANYMAQVARKMLHNLAGLDDPSPDPGVKLRRDNSGLSGSGYTPSRFVSDIPCSDFGPVEFGTETRPNPHVLTGHPGETRYADPGLGRNRKKLDLDGSRKAQLLILLEIKRNDSMTKQAEEQ